MRSLRSGLNAIGRLGWAERRLFFEAALVLTAVSLCIRVLPFRVLMRLASWPLGRGPPTAAPLDVARQVRWAVLAAAARVPWPAVCLHQGLTAQILLRRRGLASVLYYGARQDKAEGLQAHAWVRWGATDIVGGEVAHDFAVLATFPPAGAAGVAPQRRRSML